MKRFHANTLEGALVAQCQAGHANECWPWTGHIGASGYGRLFHKKKKFLAHRVAYEINHGSAGSLQVCHSCDNRRCCNPAHLWLGTQADNVADMRFKKRERYAPVSGSKHYCAKLTEEDVIAIFRSQESNKTLLERYGVSKQRIIAIRSGQSWRAVTNAERVLIQDEGPSVSARQRTV